MNNIIYVIIIAHQNIKGENFESVMTGPAYRRLEDAEAKIKQLKEKSKNNIGWNVFYMVDEVYLYD